MRWARLRDAMDDVVRVWEGNLEGIRDAPARLRWLYADAPDPPEEVALLTAASPEGPERVVGVAGVLVRRFLVGGEVRRAALLADLAVDRPHRTVLPALRLVREVRRRVDEAYDFAYGFPNPHSIGVFRRVGYEDLGPMARYARVLHHAPYVKRLVGLEGLARVGGALADAGGRGWYLLAEAAAARTWRLEWAERADERLDALWEAARGEYHTVALRDAERVDWRHLRCPGSSARLALLVSRRQPARVGAWAVVEERDGVAHVRDLFGHRSAREPLLHLLAADLRQEGAESISTCHAGDDEATRTLRRAGFHPRGSVGPVVVSDPAALAPHAQAPAFHLTEFDTDV